MTEHKKAVNFRLTEREKKRLVRLARRYDLSISRLLRKYINEAFVAEIKNKETP